MKLKIGKAHEQHGYFMTAQKDGKHGGTQMYRGVFTVYDSKAGKWHPTSDTGYTTRKDAKKWAQDQFAEFKKQGKTATIASKKGKTNFANFAERYKEFLQENIKGWVAESRKVDTLIEFFADDDLKDIDYDRIEDFKRWFSKQTYTRKDGGQEFNREKSTVNRYLARLRHMLRNGSDRYQTTVPTFGHFIKKSDEKEGKTIIGFDEFKRMIRACDDLFPRKPENRQGWKLVLLAAYTLGVRVNELFEIRRGDITRIDPENRVGAIGLCGEDSITKKHKKTVDIPTVLFDEMKAAGCFEKSNGERLFMWTKAYRKPFEKITELAKVNPKATFKSLRASNATARDASGQDLTAIQDTLGHVRGSTVTGTHYIEREADTVIEKAQPFNNFLKKLNWSSDDEILNADNLE
jgi:integrase